MNFILLFARKNHANTMNYIAKPCLLRSCINFRENTVVLTHRKNYVIVGQITQKLLHYLHGISKS